jgi:DNA invertase Pin-like site-specific DNA recombinase
MNGNFIAYHRVSTARQGRSGLGLEAQQKAIMDYLNGGSWELIGEYIEVESGKRSNNRPKLQEALKHCKMTGATLVISKIDRLARNVAFVSALMESGIEFVAVDMPTANKLTVHIIAAVAEEEARMISKRTKDALQAAKRRGVELGGSRFPGQGLSQEAIKTGRLLGDEAKRVKADRFAADLKPMIEKIQADGVTSLRGVARELNARKIKTPRGKEWTPTGVKNLMERA